MVVPEVVLLGLSTTSSTPSRGELELIEGVRRIIDVGVVALEHAVQPPLHRARALVQVPLDAMPHAECDTGRIRVRLEVARKIAREL